MSEEELKLLENESIEDEGNERFVGEEDIPHTQSKTRKYMYIKTVGVFRAFLKKVWAIVELKLSTQHKNICMY